MVQQAGSSGIGFGSQATGSPYIATESQISPVIGSLDPRTHVSGPSTYGSSSYDDRLV